MEMTVSHGNKNAYRGHSRIPGYAHQGNGLTNEGADESDFDDPGPHREMAIDVPANFIGSRKEPPRLPASMHPSSTNSSQRSNSPLKGGGSRVGGFNPPDTVQEQEVNDVNKQKERIQKYEADLRKRREIEEQKKREEDFLRTSLRGSKKLQELEEKKAAAVPAGIDNPNYEVDEGSHLPHLKHKLLSAEEINQKLQDLQSLLTNIQDENDLQQVVQFFSNPQVMDAVHIHNEVVQASLGQELRAPAHDNAQRLSQEVLQRLPVNSGNVRIDELRRLLQKPAVKNLLYCHDTLVKTKAERKKKPEVHSIEESDYLFERASQYGEENIKVVRIEKTADPLGATIRNEGESVIIGRIVKGGPADQAGLLHEGDEILDINGTDVRGKTIDEVCDLMAGLTGVLTFMIVPSQEFSPMLPNDKLVHYKAHFDYDPDDDPYIPCHELGISFRKGDVLHVIIVGDPLWWQAYREGEDTHSMAGLIPSKAFQEQKEAIFHAASLSADDNSSGKCRCHCGRRNTMVNKKKKKKQLYNVTGDGTETEEILTYEEVALYYPQPNRKRPIVLIGPPNLGRQEIRQMLMLREEERFMAAVPHTSRAPQPSERDNVDYYFISRVEFEQDIADHRFVEYGEYERNLYGTSLEAIRSVVNSGKICVLNLHPQSLRILKNSDLKPFVVFIAPPNIEKLKQLKIKENQALSEDDCLKVIEASREIEESFGHYFDYIIINYDLEKTYAELLKEINRLEVEPQWVPAQWGT